MRFLGSGPELPCNGGSCGVIPLKGRNQLAHMRIRYHFMVNLLITETLFLTKYDKNNIGRAKTHSKPGFSVND